MAKAIDLTGKHFGKLTVLERDFDIQKHDEIKNQYALEHNYILIRIPYLHYNNLCLKDLLLESDYIIKKE